MGTDCRAAAGTVCRCSPRRGRRADTEVVRNPLASPDILGVNHAASTASGRLYFLCRHTVIVIAAAAGLCGRHGGVIIAEDAGKDHQPMKLALTGVALSACWASPDSI